MLHEAMRGAVFESVPTLCPLMRAFEFVGRKEKGLTLL